MRTEIDSKGELKNAEQLLVPLPEGNLDFHLLARSLAAQLSPGDKLPSHEGPSVEWQRQGASD